MVRMCKEKLRHNGPTPRGGTAGTCTCGTSLPDDQYLQLPEQRKQKQRGRSFRHMPEKLMFVGSVFSVVTLFYAFIHYQWALPWIYVVVTPVLLTLRTVLYWRNKWQFFMIDFCYSANAMLMIFLTLSGNENLFRVVFALANGPVLVAAIVYKNSLVFHDYDKVTSVYIHILPAMITFCVRWFPSEMSGAWFQPFLHDISEIDVFWLYMVPFCCFFIHSCFYCLIVNVLVRPKDPYVTSYKYLVEKYERLKILNGPMGVAIVYYSLNWLFCLSSLLLSILAYRSFVGHCVILAVVFTATVYNGAGYYMHMLSKRGTAKYA